MIRQDRARRWCAVRQMALPGLVVVPGACIEVPSLEETDEAVLVLAELMTRMVHLECEERDED